MGKYWTLSEIKTKVQRETDTEAEDFIQPDELLQYINEGIDEAEAEIHKLGLEDDYFLSKTEYDFTVGDEFFNLPTDIYAHKIRGIVYSDGDLIYPIKRFRGPNLFEVIANAQHYTNTGDYYKYILLNDNSDSGATPAPQIMLVPTARKTRANVMRVWYVRNAHRLAADTDICDVPEFAEFIIKSSVFKIFNKEGHPLADSKKLEMEQERQRMIDTLATAVPDADNTLIPDFTWYNETS